MSSRPEAVSEAAAALLAEKCRRDPVFWLVNCCKTLKEHRAEDEDPIKPFPMRPYMKPIIEMWRTSRTVHIVKSRQMSISWLAFAMLLWEAEFVPFTTNVIISKADEEAIKGIGRIKFMYDNQPKWLKAVVPLAKKMRDLPQDLISFKNGSHVQALPQGADKIRGYVPTTVVLDEMAFQAHAEETYGACVPCSRRIVTVSSAGPGFFHRLVTE